MMGKLSLLKNNQWSRVNYNHGLNNNKYKNNPCLKQPLVPAVTPCHKEVILCLAKL